MNIRPLSPELAEIAIKEINEDPKRMESDIQHIKDWMSKQPHLIARTDDQWIVTFLRGCKYSLERTKEKLDLYYSLRTVAPDFFRIKTTDPCFKEILSLGSYVMLPSTSPKHPQITIIRPGKYDPDIYTLTDILAATSNLEKILLADDDHTIIIGRKTILDLEGVTMAHFLQMTPSVMKTMVVIGQDATPTRFKGAHYINLPPGFEVVFNAMRSLLNEKNKNRLFVHNRNYDQLYEHIPKELLPAEYGGNAGSIQDIIDVWNKKIEEYSSWLEDDLKYGTDETKRPGKPKDAADMFGLDGSFRKLEFD